VASAVTLSPDATLELADTIAATYADPLAFVRLAYDWGQPGTPLANYDGPDIWQVEVLEDIGRQVRARKFNGRDPVLPIRIAISSGHGVGKSSLMAWLVDWIMSTRPRCQGTITANTFDQLEQRTWAAVQRWTKLCVTASWFEVNSRIMYRHGFREQWKCSPQSCAEENSEAFAGQHAADSTSFYGFDESSAVPDKIWEVAEGGLTDGESFIVCFGNPTRNSGAFHRAVFGAQRERWTTWIIDARTCAFPNKELIQQFIDDYGEDSDFVRVRVRGLPPNADELQYIDQTRIVQAQRNQSYVLQHEPLIAGVDVSGGGAAWTVCMFRRGFDARAIKPITLTGEQTTANERQLVIDTLANALVEHPITAMFVDSAFGAPIVDRLRRMGYTHVHEVNFGAMSSDAYCENARAAMWSAMKTWLPKGAIDHQDHRLATELAAPGFHLNKKNKLVLESKAEMARRGVASPDRADALALTFAMPVRISQRQRAGWAKLPASPYA
jgi:hypothetical protein